MRYLLFLLLFSILNSPLFAQSYFTEGSKELLTQIIVNQDRVLGRELHCKNALSVFYLEDNFKQVWTEDKARILLDFIKSTANHALNPKDYHIESIELGLNAKFQDRKSIFELEVLLSDAFLQVSSHLLSGKLDKETLKTVWGIRTDEENPINLLQSITIDSNLFQSLQSLLPQEHIYWSMMSAFLSYRLIEYSDWPISPTGPTIKLEDSDERIPGIAKKLYLLGDLCTKYPDNFYVYTEELQESIINFQERHGLDNDGNIGTKTIEALNVSIKDRIAQTKANMERWRWLPRKFSDYYVLVNIANYKLDVVEKGEVIQQHRVISGKIARETPVLSSKIKYLVFNPTWTIPPGILTKDVIPAVSKNNDYLAKKRITVMNSQGEALDASQVDWSKPEVKGYTYRQASGLDNSLGVVKFMFDNPYSVYLHDTPNKELFNKFERALSSGCIRVEHPLDLAVTLLKDDKKYSKEKVLELVRTGKTQTIFLGKYPDIHILYWTAWSSQDGQIHFRKDVYGRDARLIAALR